MIKTMVGVRSTLKARLDAVKKIRDKIDNDISEFQMLLEDCDESIDHLERAIDEVNDARDSLSKLV